MNKQHRKIIAFMICLSLISIYGATQTKGRSLLLVCSSDSTLSSLSNSDVRKVFLGIPTKIDGVWLKPLLNASDSLLTEVFLQKIIFMSNPDYERQLISRVFRSGGTRPPEYENILELVNELRRLPGSVSFMWSDQVENNFGLKTLSVLWANSSN